MLPWPSCLSVSNCPETRLRHWSSLRYLRISPLHRKFQSPLQSSSTPVSNAVSELSSEISHLTYGATYAPFTPNESEQRLRPLYYRGCWHRVSRLFLFWYYQRTYSYYVRLVPKRKSFTTRRPSSLTRRRFVRLSPIAKDSRLQPPVGVWTVSQFQCG